MMKNNYDHGLRERNPCLTCKYKLHCLIHPENMIHGSGSELMLEMMQRIFKSVNRNIIEELQFKSVTVEIITTTSKTKSKTTKAMI